MLRFQATPPFHIMIPQLGKQQELTLRKLNKSKQKTLNKSFGRQEEGEEGVSDKEEGYIRHMKVKNAKEGKQDISEVVA